MPDENGSTLQALQDELETLRIRCRHLENNLLLTRKEYEETSEHYFDILAHTEDLVENRTAELAEHNRQLEDEISQRKRVEQALKQSERDYRDIFENAHDAILVYDLQSGTIIDTNEQACLIYGYRRDELLGRNMQSIALEPEIEQNEVEQLHTRNGRYVYETRHLRRDGTVMVMEVNLSMVHVQGRQAVMSINRDITERREAEDELMRNERFMQDFFDAIQEGICVLGTDYTVQRVNSFTEKLYSRQRPLVGRKCYEVFQQRSDICPFCPTKHTLTDGEPHQNIVPFPNAKNPTRWLELSVYPLKDNQNDTAGVIMSLRDITTRLQAERELREREQELTLMSESSVDVIFTMDRHGIIRYISKSSRDLFGRTPEEMIGHPFSRFVPPEQVETYKEVLLNSKERRAFRNFESSVLYREGQTVPVEISGQTVERLGEQITQGTIRDITERKLAEQSLLESEEKFRMLAENIPGVVFMFETYGGKRKLTLFLGSGMAALVGEEQAARIGDNFMTFFELVSEAERKAVFAEMERCEREQTILDQELTVKLDDGRQHWVRCIASARDMGNDVHRWQGVLVDITDRKRAEEELQNHRMRLEELVTERTAELARANMLLQDDIHARMVAQKALEESEERFRYIVEKADIAVLIDDNRGHFLYWNHRFLDMFGYTEDEFHHLTIHDLLHPDDVFTMLRQHIRRAKGKPVSSRIEFRGIRKDGSIIHLEVDALPIRENGIITGTRSYIWDITDRKRAEEALQQAKEAAESANRSKSEFIFNVSHEIRTPLNCIIGFSELMMQSDDIGEAHTQSRTILNESEILLMLINDLLDHAKLEAGKMVLDFRPFNLTEVVESILSVLHMKAEDKGLHFEASIAADVPNFLYGDSLRLRQILMNLVSNAVKFTDDGSVGVFVELAEPADGDRCLLRFSVIDTGIGISQEKQDLIFQRFTQADGSTTRRYGGTGLGTTIARQFVELMHGQIGLQSEPGKGSEFWCVIPFDVCDRETYESSQETVEEEATGTIAPVQNLQILLAEDYVPNQQVARMHLENAGYTVTIASNGEEAVEACKQQRFDLILMDIQMPRMDGYAATRAIRGDESLNRETIIVGLTAHADPVTRRHCLEATMSDTITKPIRRESFLQSIRRWSLAANESDDTFEIADMEPAPLQEADNEQSLLPLDYRDALSEFDNNKEILDAVIGQFIESMQDQIDVMRSAVEQRDAELLRSEAHKIKGGAANLTAMPLSAAAAALERAAKEDRMHEAGGLLEQLENAFKALVDYMHAF